ncbi:MAG: hypothetical protein ATN35_03630 [Epulopiscium sp. Nele67-Bin004]|nr:MAG: hypothetical protein ATN35_03630 [Epulopiscium sp. Nele67-Bin004]
MKDTKKFYLVVGGIAIFVAILPLLIHKIPMGFDFWYHIVRISEISSGLQSGQFPVRITENLINGYGYGTALFYPDLFLYIPAMLNAVGLPLEIAVRIYMILCVVGLFFTTYLCSKMIIKDKTISVGVACLVILAQYNICNMYVRSAIGEVQAMVFVPLVIYGFYNFIYEEFDKKHFLIIGFIGISYSHVISTFLTASIGAIWILLNLRKLNKKKIMQMVGCVAVVLFATIGFYFMLFEQQLSGEFKYATATSRVSSRALTVKQLFEFSYNAIGLNVIVPFFISIAVYITKKQHIKNAVGIGVMGLIIWFSISNVFPWEWFNNTPANSIQFPWRLSSYATLYIALFVGLVANKFVRRKQFGVTCLVAGLSAYALCIYVSPNINTVLNQGIKFINVTETYIETLHTNYNVLMSAEWLPVSVEPHVQDFIESEPLITNDLGQSIDYTRVGIQITTMHVDNWGEMMYIDVPLIYYKGYTATLGDVSLDVVANPENGIVRVYLSDDLPSGQIFITYGGTTVQKISGLISTVTIILYGLYLTKEVEKCIH